jgi:dihydroorotase
MSQSQTTLFRNAQLVTDGQVWEADLLVRHGRIAQIATGIQTVADVVVEARGRLLLPGLIDDQVHFREPGLTHKGDIQTESRAAVAGGITSYMEMPNTSPAAVTHALLEQKYARAAQVSAANYSFFLGGSNDNLDEIKRTDPKSVCGVKVFMGSSTGDLLVDDRQALEAIFAHSPTLIATHCEWEPRVRERTAQYRERYGEAIPISAHPEIRDHEACRLSSLDAIDLATRHNARLHILHISTAEETALFRNDIPLSQKRITAEACVHHLWFTDQDYPRLGSRIKWNPAVKTAADRDAIWAALLDDRIDVLATDHAPHTWAEKQNPYLSCPSGGPLVQHALLALLDCVAQGRIDLPTLVRKACHAPADLFAIADRGYLREGYWADLVLVDAQAQTAVTPESLLYKCGWSPFDGHTFHARIDSTWVNGHHAWDGHRVTDQPLGQRLNFAR